VLIILIQHHLDVFGSQTASVMLLSHKKICHGSCSTLLQGVEGESQKTLVLGKSTAAE
jgi:ABC-type Mn2+/Zn2+ transport system ATPase subunit